MHKAAVWWLAVGVLAGGAALLLAAQVLGARHTFHGSLIEPASPAPGFTLARADGSTFRLSDLRGRLVLLYFGYTSCPDVCPATLADLRQVVESLGGQAEQVQVVFVTVDPERDTVQKVQEYVAAFDAAFIGLSSEKAVLERIWKDYGMYVEVRPVGETYLVDHSSRVYLIDRQGNLLLTYPFGVKSTDILADIRYLLR